MIVTFLDTETTGLLRPSIVPVHRQPRVIELYMISVSGSERDVAKELNQLFNPGTTLLPEITRITGLVDNDLRGQPRFYEHAQEIKEQIENSDRVVGHNMMFDKCIIDAEFARLGRQVYWPELYCTVESTEHLKGHRFKQGDLYKYLFDRDPGTLHRAKEDVMILKECYEELVNRGEITE